MKRIGVLSTVLILLLLSACSTAPRVPHNAPPPIRLPQIDGVTLNEISDPFERVNRFAYRCNRYLDDYLLLPLVRAYRFVLPDPVEQGVSNALDNIGEIRIITNELLQLKFAKAETSTSRLVINSTIGLLGLWDPAAKHFNLRRQEEDFGQTLGHYGVGHGPYLVLPLFGPSNLRDTSGLTADGLMFVTLDPLNFDHNELDLAFYSLETIDTRKRESFRYFGSGSPFEYELVRMIYTQQRDLKISR